MQYAEVADRLFSLEFEFIERHLAWLHAQCRGDWILRLDGDEIPSPEMLAEVSAMRRDRSVNGVLFARRNLFPTVASYISQDPWYPDFQLRLVRNDGALRFGGTVHSGPELSLPARFVEAPIYHLPFICADVEERRNRARRYEMLSPGLIAPTCLAANRMELPESLSPLHVSLVPQADRVLIESVQRSPRACRNPRDPDRPCSHCRDRCALGRAHVPRVRLSGADRGHRNGRSPLAGQSGAPSTSVCATTAPSAGAGIPLWAHSST